jgi:hypothetical protein
MKHEERKEGEKKLKVWKKPELIELDKKRTNTGFIADTPEGTPYTSP